MNNIADLNPSQIAMDPLLFHELEKSDILYKLTSEFRYSEEEAVREFEAATAILARLKPIRNSQSKTDDYLLEVLSALRLRVKTFVIMHLLRATETNDTYCHAYNNFVYYANRYLRLNFHRKEISERELQVLLMEEKIRERELMALRSPGQNGSAHKPADKGRLQPAENPLLFDEMRIRRFYLAFNGFLWEDTDLETVKNWFRVIPSGKPVFLPKMITYFCYAFSKMEERMIAELKPKNINSWIRPLINGNNYSYMKNRCGRKEKMEEIERRVELTMEN